MHNEVSSRLFIVAFRLYHSEKAKRAEPLLQRAPCEPIRELGKVTKPGGDAAETSDVDLLIVVGEIHGRDRMEMMTQLWRALSDVRGPKDLLAYSRAEVERWQHTSNPVIARAFREDEIPYRSER